ncbi:hypothetical protein JGS6364_15881 [[Clostridium] sordellii]|uniref:Uncharacterized protein n=4 Tax=Paraclostridium sordellii TaxID=1505 RepID=A0ABP1XT58_PARSO|nr:hypothetical protein [Paeniclostridium sordellii]AUN13420.1 hypothetical protein RSJ16_03965 [Paeniclostridium sordellii]EPZ58240.1 hypothetical protein H476_1727 [[Clostridium] sordellii VPI 9048] [Paeniclostridium sordellii VPI 9048]MDU1454147.1 hypothetical protein [Paeniclostridium sordellii]TAN68756.1 hypothetical protein WS9_004700 [Paeniclostridium sordellii 8483]CEJ72727.1 hypothetical protein ATCC9714_06151 [[Clostridium] sordellii] [Paeniclostridium sordellii]
MKKIRYYFVISFILIALSAVMFLIHYLVFGQALNTAYYSLMNLCFIPINSLVVTIILEKLIDYRAKKDRIEKINMLVGIFFTEVGGKLMHLIIDSDKDAKNYITNFEDLNNIKKCLNEYDYKVDMNNIDLCSIKNILLENNNLFVTLISNENVFQHQIFTDLLMSVVHLRDEIIFMEKDDNLELNINHLENDVIRVYKNISIQWISYLEYLNKSYPFLYNNAIRVNPFKFD